MSIGCADFHFPRSFCTPLPPHTQRRQKVTLSEKITPSGFIFEIFEAKTAIEMYPSFSKLNTRWEIQLIEGEAILESGCVCWTGFGFL